MRKRISPSLALLTLVFLFATGGSVSAQAQEPTFAAGDRIEVDVNMASSPEYERWRSGTIIEVKMWQGMVAGYHIRTDDGGELVSNATHMRPGAAPVSETADAGEAGEPPADDAENPWTADQPTDEPAEEPAAPAPAVGATNPGGGACQMGARVTDRENRSGVVYEADGPNCRVRFDDGTTSFYLAWMLRVATTTEAAAASAGGGALTPGSYLCWAANGVAGTLRLVIVNGSQYRNEQGTTGTYALDPQSGQITFQSGPWEGFFGTSLEPGKIGISSRPGGFSSTVCDRQ